MEVEGSTALIGEKDLYEAQFFGFTPRSLLDGVYEALTSFGKDRLKSLERQLLESELVPADVSSEHVSRALNKVLEQFNERIDHIYEKFEDYVLKNIMYIPSNVLLPEDQVQANQVTKEDEEAVDTEIKNLEKLILAEEALKSALVAEQKELDAYLEELLQHQDWLKALSVHTSENFQGHLNDTVLKSSELYCSLSKMMNSKLLPIKYTEQRSLDNDS